ncbi:arylsulfatase [Gaetbulibacter saemankumensis]|uniref:arylsulfatase n=1 Tax=Gaetbulibacter saemankumensis TaxID=311208 RepID=UPI0003FD9295|nr:arylsulfatase [Gaetbulibacter saemankumensis]
MKLVKNGFLLLVTMVLVSCKANKTNAQKAEERPNIILIMSDDMGYSDLAPYGGEINTPNLTALADGGLKFTQFYNTARCCPTRASLMTGCYPHQAGIGYMTQQPQSKGMDLGVPGYRGFLNSNTVTIAEALRESGYSTMMTGKWHLGIHEKEQWPMQRGFDAFYGFLAGAGSFFKPEHPRGITEGNEPITITDENYYTTDAFTDKAIEYIDAAKSKDKEKPFFLYLAYNAPHWPIQAPKEDIEKYRGKYMEGWEKLREERYERMKKMGLVDPSWELSEAKGIVAWDSLSEEKQKEMDFRMAIYAAMIDRMDQNIGRLVKNLKEKNLYDNTIIIFLNDNGACAEGGMLGRGAAKNLGTNNDLGISYGEAWANASNTPYRLYKHWTHEGGIATPFIVHWPKGISEDKKGAIVNQYGFLPDVMATCLDLAQMEQPKEYNGNVITQHSGKSLKPLFSEYSGQIHTEPIFFEHEGNKAVRLGKYKLVQRWVRNKDNWELYDMEADRSETKNLINEMPEKANEMKAMYDEWAARSNVLPYEEVIKMRPWK